MASSRKFSALDFKSLREETFMPFWKSLIVTFRGQPDYYYGNLLSRQTNYFTYYAMIKTLWKSPENFTFIGFVLCNQAMPKRLILIIKGHLIKILQIKQIIICHNTLRKWLSIIS